MTLKTSPQFPNFHEIKHPLVQHKISLLRDQCTSKKEFRELVHEITLLLAYEATINLPLVTKAIQTPLESVEGQVLMDKKPVLLPIMRAGLGMVEAFLTLMPAASVGHIGLYRNEITLKPECYYFKIPTQSEQRQFFVCDPMLATAGSVCEAIDRLKAVNIQKITFVCLVAAPEGVAQMQEKHPDVPIFAANLDRQLDAHGYILPGLGDAGDRLLGTR